MHNPLSFIFMLGMIVSLNALHAQESVRDMSRAATDAAFSELERQLIREYYGDDAAVVETDKAGKQAMGGKSMPPGLAKRDALPPGLGAQLERNGTLPPGLAKRDLPTDLERRLPPVREGYTRSVLEDMTVVLIEEATGRIADIIRDTTRDNR